MAAATVAKRKLEAPLKTFTIKQYKPTDPVATLAEKSRKLLGYTRLVTHIRQPLELGKALMELDIHPLHENTVEEYKQKKLKELRKRYHSNGYTEYNIRWVKLSLRGYDKPIPEFVLNKAVAIAEKVKGVEFEVEEVRVSTEQKTRNLDPFLIAKKGPEEFYVEVWEEPEFETKMIDR